jgi:hypothetical protein
MDIAELLCFSHSHRAHIDANGQLRRQLDRVDTHRLKFKSPADRYKTSKPEHAILHDAATESWNKCRKYFDKVDETPTYYAAMILQPHVRLQWLKKHWQNHTEEYVREWVPERN